MKKLICLLVFCMMLCGCGNNEANEGKKKDAESISDTVDSTKESIQETSDEVESIEGDSGKIITLTDGIEGEYGQNDLFDGEPYLRYHVPAGNYKVKCKIRGGFYIETIELHKEDGWDTATTIQQINMSEGEETDISIEDGQCISLIINTEIELIKQ